MKDYIGLVVAIVVPTLTFTVAAVKGIIWQAVQLNTLQTGQAGLKEIYEVGHQRILERVDGIEDRLARLEQWRDKG